MKFLNFLKLNKNGKEVDEALDKCAASYQEFQEHIHQGHFQNYKDFKLKFRQESLSLRKEIIQCKDNDLKLLMIKHLQKQLDYLNENYFGPYAAQVDLDRFNEFITKNYPYEEKVDKLKSEYLLGSKNTEKNNNHPIANRRNRI